MGQTRIHQEANDSPPKRTISRRDFLGEVSLILGGFPLLARLDNGPFEGARTEVCGAAHAEIQGTTLSIGNALIAAKWDCSPTGLRILRVEDRISSDAFQILGPAFSLRLADASEISSLAMNRVGAPRIEPLSPVPRAARIADRENGISVKAIFEDAQRRVRATWRGILRDNSHYVRQEVTLEAIGKSLPVIEITLLATEVHGAQVMGSVKGTPVVFENWFLGFEHPLSESSIEEGRVRSSLQRQLALEHGHAASYSSVIGVARGGQLRRDFLRYIEHERAHPYRTFLHYNSWYDLGYFTPYDQAGALDVIRAFGTELRDKRGVVLDSFLFDDGWDNHKSLWHFNSGFPHGFAPLKQAAAEFGAAPGVWLSPWGGYEEPRKERLAYGKKHGFEENSGGFVLTGPRYFRRFREVCMNMIHAYRVNQFKFDGTGNASTVYPGSKFNSDFDAMISLIGDLRRAEPELYINLTTGTYSSPFWLRYADSIWRGGEDHSFAGVGTDRQQWITYRDAATHEHAVRRGPLYPLNSLMLHGLIYAQHAQKLNTDPGHDFASEVRSYFGSGTQLQEMYITHSLLSGADWDTLAEAAQWSRRNADILVDTHWIGGDPGNREVYGWASWSPRGGIVTLRNPDTLPHAFNLDLQTAFELPAGATTEYIARSPWKDAAKIPEIPLRPGEPHSLMLEPFEVLTLEATPR